MIDGTIYVLIALFGALASALATDDAAKFIAPAALWYSKNICASMAAACLALKMYRSTTYSNFVHGRQNGNAAAQPPSAAPPQKNGGDN